MSKRNQQGFTIVELLIAMTIFTIVLLVLTGAVVQIGRLYTKGLTASRTQEVARAVIDDLSRAIQYTPGVIKELAATPADNTSSVCVGSRRYDFIQNRLVDKNQTTGRSLVSGDDPANCTSTTNLITASTGNEMLGNDMRVSNLAIDTTSLTTGAYRVTVRIVYGADDLLCTQAAGNCNNNVELNAAQLRAAKDLQCKNIRSGTQFCAVSELSTIVERRLQ